MHEEQSEERGHRQENREDVIRHGCQNPAKRSYETASIIDTSSGPSSKRFRPTFDLPDFDDFDEFAPTPPKKTPTLALLPQPSDTVVQLRFQLSRFKGVYRVVQLPLSFTFAHLYRLNLLLFGWSGYHLHEFEVLTNVELYSPNNRKGEIKKHRSFRVPEEPDKNEDREIWRSWLLTYGKYDRDPAMRITPQGSRETSTSSDTDDEWVVFDRSMAVPEKKDAEVTLGDIWARRSRDNFTNGKCANRDIAIKLTYDLGACWEVDITVDLYKNEKEKFIWTVDTPRNSPVVIEAKGAPPLEDAFSYHGDIDPKKKTVSSLLFAPDTFEKYSRGELCAATRKTGLAVYSTEENSHPQHSQNASGSEGEGEDEEESDED